MTKHNNQSDLAINSFAGRAKHEDAIRKEMFDADCKDLFKLDANGKYFYYKLRLALFAWQAAIASVSAQPQVELTGEEIIKIYDTHVNSRSYIFIDQARAVLAAHKSKNKPGLKVENV